jgi:hypothetical protein
LFLFFVCFDGPRIFILIFSLALCSR